MDVDGACLDGVHLDVDISSYLDSIDLGGDILGSGSDSGDSGDGGSGGTSGSDDGGDGGDGDGDGILGLLCSGDGFLDLSDGILSDVFLGDGFLGCGILSDGILSDVILGILGGDGVNLDGVDMGVGATITILGASVVGTISPPKYLSIDCTSATSAAVGRGGGGSTIIIMLSRKHCHVCQLTISGDMM
jgi:hypothetical protein